MDTGICPDGFRYSIVDGPSLIFASTSPNFSNLKSPGHFMLGQTPAPCESVAVSLPVVLVSVARGPCHGDDLFD